MVPIAQLSHVEQNYRTITPTEFEKLKTSIDKDPDFFQRRPCLVNKLGDQLVVYAGNHKLDAAISLGWKEVPCIVSQITVEEQNRRMLKDNTHAGVFDLDFMATAYDKNFLSEVVGFNTDLFGDEDYKPDDLVDQTPIDKKLYAFFNNEKLFVDEETDEWLMQVIKTHGDETTTIFGFMEKMLTYYNRAVEQNAA
jgi:hypothetical protein